MKLTLYSSNQGEKVEIDYLPSGAVTFYLTSAIGTNETYRLQETEVTVPKTEWALFKAWMQT